MRSVPGVMAYRAYRSVGATADERRRQLPGDALIADAIGQLTHAITIDRPRRDIWPWILQMGAGTRAGWYSYDRLDNGGHPSATRILPYLQHVDVGTLFPAMPGRTDGFHVLQIEHGVSLVIGWRAPTGPPTTTWAFVLEDAGNDTTRLIVRSRANLIYRFGGLPPAIGMTAIRAVHFVMQRKQLLGIARRAEEFDALLDQFMPEYDVIERRRVRVAATPDTTMSAAAHIDLHSSLLIRAIVKLRALAMGAKEAEAERPRGLLAETASMGWRLLAEVPGREVVMGAAAQPWRADVTFLPLAPQQFATFDTPGYVKIAWTLRADAAWPDGSVFTTETRVVATDPEPRAKFRRYWRRVVPGVVSIRWILLRLLKGEAERNRLESLTHGRSH